MKTIKSYKYKLYGVNPKKGKYLHDLISISGIIYNHCIAVHKCYYRIYGKSLSVYTLKRHITKLKKQKRYGFWKRLDAQAIQDIAFRIDKGYKLFFRNSKLGIDSAPPSFRKLSKYTSFTLAQTGWKLITPNRIRILGREYTFHNSREITGKIKTVNVQRNTKGEFFVTFAAETVTLDALNQDKLTGRVAGFDFGLKTFLTGFDGSETFEIESPEFFKRGLKDIQKASKAVSSKKKGSSNRRACKYTLANLHEKIANQRRDFFFKLANDLTDKYDYLFFEDLNLKGMQKLWGKKVNDLAFTTFLSILEHIATSKGKVVRKVDRFYASTKLCSKCNYKNDTLTLKDRYWLCPKCSTRHDRDKNAAINIYNGGISSFGLDTVSRDLDLASVA